jgi:hypothetical protein
LLQPYLLLEAVGMNLIENSDYEVDAVGSVLVNLSTIARDNAQAFNGAWSLKITSGASVQSGVIWQLRSGSRIPATAATTYTISVWVYAPAASVGTTWALHLQWFNSVPAVISTSDSPNFVLVAGWQRLTFTATAPAATVTVQPFLGTVANSAGLIIWADVPQFEAQAFATSAIPTGVGAVTRNADNCSVPWYGNFPTWLYARWLERGSFLDSSATSRGVVQVGANSGPRLLLFKEGVTQIPRGLFTDNVNFTRSTPVGTPAYAQVVEALVLFYPADGSVQVLQAFNNGAVSDGGRSAALGATVPLTAAGNLLALATATAGAADGWMALSQLKLGLGGGTLVSTLPDARAIPV